MNTRPNRILRFSVSRQQVQVDMCTVLRSNSTYISAVLPMYRFLQVFQAEQEMRNSFLEIVVTSRACEINLFISSHDFDVLLERNVSKYFLRNKTHDLYSCR